MSQVAGPELTYRNPTLPGGLVHAVEQIIDMAEPGKIVSPVMLLLLCAIFFPAYKSGADQKGTNASDSVRKKP
ncbi:hypothetical protein DM02DRAFT_2532 [Periconia macrospinosa]|uniref:Uncharacterized protein n=1 Tax=Periconia macrospinosa TaxID=97972 RepID=A0A2V1ED11_9PLEO|nr:hypothetical protein DM02DRAFT_2532 [Periconia macrospinosa]